MAFVNLVQNAFLRPMLRTKRPTCNRQLLHSLTAGRHTVSASLRTRRLATRPNIVPDGTMHTLKADIRTRRDKMEGPLKDTEGRVYLKSMTLAELEDWVETELQQKRFRARQLWQWLYKTDKLASTFDEMTNLAKDFRQKLGETARIDALAIDKVHRSKDGTRKIVFRLDSGGVIESVLIPADGRTTLCVSSQWGCALACQFCLTGRSGFKGHLNQAEIVDQVVMARRFFERESHISNIVFMGEG